MKKNLVNCLLFLVISWHMHDAVAQLVDPTRPPSYVPPGSVVDDGESVEPAENFTLIAIYITPSKRLAIINGRLVSAGDTIQEYTVTGIYRDTVELSGPSNNKMILQLARTVKQRKH